jgi:hypothetical protein
MIPAGVIEDSCVNNFFARLEEGHAASNCAKSGWLGDGAEGVIFAHPHLFFCKKLSYVVELLPSSPLGI